MTSKRIPEVDMACCTMCLGCLDVCPQVFLHNQAGDYIEIAELETYPEEPIQEAINLCPKDCIFWSGD